MDICIMDASSHSYLRSMQLHNELLHMLGVFLQIAVVAEGGHHRFSHLEHITSPSI